MHPNCKMAKSLTKKQRHEWNQYAANLKYDEIDLLISRLYLQPEIRAIAESVKEKILALPIFDDDGKGSTWAGTHEIFSGFPIKR